MNHYSLSTSVSSRRFARTSIMGATLDGTKPCTSKNLFKHTVHIPGGHPSQSRISRRRWKPRCRRLRMPIVWVNTWPFCSSSLPTPPDSVMSSPPSITAVCWVVSTHGLLIYLEHLRSLHGWNPRGHLLQDSIIIIIIIMEVDFVSPHLPTTRVLHSCRHRVAVDLLVTSVWEVTSSSSVPILTLINQPSMPSMAITPPVHIACQPLELSGNLPLLSLQEWGVVVGSQEWGTVASLQEWHKPMLVTIIMMMPV